jgi:hypothetical protein
MRVLSPFLSGAIPNCSQLNTVVASASVSVSASREERLELSFLLFDPSSKFFRLFSLRELFLETCSQIGIANPTGTGTGH